MSTTPISGFSAMLTRLGTDPEIGATQRTHRDIEILDRGIDTAQPTFELPTLVAFRGSISGADRVRLPPPPNAGRNVRRASQRILDADTSAAASSKDGLVQEARLRHALRAIARVVDFVQVEATQKRRS